MTAVLKKSLIELYRLISRVRSVRSHVTAHRSVLFQGRTRFPKKRGRVVLHKEVTLNACNWSNSLNVPNALVLCAYEGAEIILHARSGVSSSRLIASSGITVGEDSLIGAGCLLCDSDMHEVPLLSDRATQTAPIMIGNRVFIGANSTILKGVTIGDGAVIGAGSVVSRDVPAGVLVAGNPAGVIREL